MMRIIGLGAILAAAVTPAAASDSVKFGTNWLAQAEHGGFYQALVDGTYARRGLDVSIIPGGAQTNNLILLPTGRIDFYMGGDMIESYSALEQGIPIVAVAAVMQKTPQIVMSHPGTGHDTFESLKGAPIYLSKDALSSFYRWMETAYGFSEDRVKPYDFVSAPFMADRGSAQQGFLTAEPFEIERQGGFKPNVFLLADHGFSTYATLIVTRTAMVKEHPDIVQRFVDASMIGWYNYLYGDNAKANAAIKADNPEMTDEQIAYSVAAMKRFGIVDSGDAKRLGIGAMTDERQADFFRKMVEAGVVSPGLDYRRSYTLTFVDHKVGLDLAPHE